MAKKPKDPNALREIHTRIFTDDVDLLQKIATESGLSWQIELRLLIRRALKNERRDVLILREKP